VKINETIKLNNVANLEYGSKEMAKLAKRIKRCSITAPQDADKLASSIIESSFFLNCFGVASASFKKMYSDLEAGGEKNLKGDVLYYLHSEFNEFYKQVQENKKKAEVQNDNEN